MIPHVLLTGAGFSYNWGGYLAKEAALIRKPLKQREEIAISFWVRCANLGIVSPT